MTSSTDSQRFRIIDSGSRRVDWVDLRKLPGEL
jgi:hypothetical protein